jgi:hypothetical protein
VKKILPKSNKEKHRQTSFLLVGSSPAKERNVMKAAFLFIATLAVTVGIGALCVKTSHAAEPVDAYVTPVPVTPPGTNAAILPPGTYHAVQPNGVRLSGWVHSPYVSQFPMPTKTPSASPKAKMPQRDPQLRFVPVQPQFPTLVRPGK